MCKLQTCLIWPNLFKLELLQLCGDFLEIVRCGMRVIWVKLCAKIPQICQICAVMRDYAEEKKLSIQEMNSTQITITIQKHKSFNCFRIKGRPVSKQDIVVICKDAFNT